jgi:hypothetical protein
MDRNSIAVKYITHHYQTMIHKNKNKHELNNELIRHKNVLRAEDVARSTALV